MIASVNTSHRVKSLALLLVVFISPASLAWAAPDTGTPLVSGFVDAGWFHDSDNSSPTSANGAHQAFIVRDGAVYFQKSFSLAGVLLDVPFQSDISTGNSSLSITKGFDYKGQAYLHMKYENGVFWKLGRFDKIFGFEANDTKDLRFTHQGLLYSNFAPRTHQGWLLGIKLGTIDLQGYVAHTNGLLGSGVSTLGGTYSDGYSLRSPLNASQPIRNYDFGFQASLDVGDALAKIGYRFRKTPSQTAEGLLDAILGYKVSNLTLGAGFDYAKYSENGTHPQNAWGALAQADYSITPALQAGARAEYTSHAGGLDGAKAFRVTVGPSYRYAEALTLKADYSYMSDKFSGVMETENSHWVAADVIFAF
jgi:hypothetical protein